MPDPSGGKINGLIAEVNEGQNAARVGFVIDPQYRIVVDSNKTKRRDADLRKLRARIGDIDNAVQE
ncbi:Uncharacterised protein [Enterobacter cloacae]|nr:Uncharacterised protein [Enterobacter cloacae]